MKTISPLKIMFLCGVAALFFSCKNKDVPHTTPESQENSLQDTIRENSNEMNDTTAVNKDTINGTTPTGSNERGQ